MASTAAAAAVPTEAPDFSRLDAVTCRSVFVVAAAAAVVVAASRLLPESGGAGAGKGGRRPRLPILDNAKFLCITVIIYGHFLYYNIDQTVHMPLHDQATWLKGSNKMMLFVMGSTNWGINMMCFLSGYVTKKPLSDAYAQRFFVGLVLPTVFWLCFAKPVLLRVMMWPDVATARRALGEFFSGTAFHHEWYLEALILWRLLAFFLRPMRPLCAVAVALAVASLGGYFDVGEAGFFSYDHAVGYLPLFVAGMYTPLDRLVAAVPRTRATVAAGVCVVVGLPLLVDTLLEPLPDNHGTYQWFWASSEYHAATGAAALGHGLPLHLYWVRRLAKACLDLTQGLAFLVCVVPRRATWFTHYGKHTLYPFLVHEVALFHRNEVIKALPLPVLTNPAAHALVLVSQYAVIVGLTVMMSSAPARAAFAPILEPQWLGRILYPSAAAAGKEHAGPLLPTSNSTTDNGSGGGGAGGAGGAPGAEASPPGSGHGIAIFVHAG